MRPYRIMLVVLSVSGVLTVPFQTGAQITSQEWLQRHTAAGTGPGSSGAVGIAVDRYGNVFVTGHSSNGTGEDCVTLGYSNAGTPLWTNRYAAPGDFAVVPKAIAVDGKGNVFVTGSSFDPPPSSAVPATDYSYVTLAYSGSGVPLWTNTYSVAGRDHAVAVAADPGGNVIVTGDSYESTTGHAMTTIAYSGAGVPLWTNRYEGAEPGGQSQAGGIAVDRKGRVFLAGNSDNAIDVVAYSNAGAMLWIKRYQGPTTYDDAVSAVAVDCKGNVFVTGASKNPTLNFDYLTLACSGEGAPLWTNRYSTANDSQADAIAVDGNGSVFVTGGSWSGIGFPDIATVAYSGAGVPLWTNRYDGPANKTDWATAVATDREGNVFVTGYSTGVSTKYDYVTIGYSSRGALLWTSRYTGPGDGWDQATGVATDGSGNVFVTGRFWNGTSSEFATIKYSSLRSTPIVIQQLGNQVVLSWTNALFELQTAPTLSDTFTNLSRATSPYTNTMTGGQRYFRLITQ